MTIMTQQGQSASHGINDLGLQADLAMWTRSPIERNRFEHHPENASPYDILLGLLGRQELVSRGWLT
ncbi:MAG: hypothetical protein U0232_11930 [Thermomicrobiales bacterium]